MAEIWGNLSMAEELRSPFAPVGLGEVEEEVAALELGHELMPPPGGIGQLVAPVQQWLRGGPWDWSRAMEEQELWPEHARFMDDLVADGFLILGGPLEDGRRVLHIVDAESAEAVHLRRQRRDQRTTLQACHFCMGCHGQRTIGGRQGCGECKARRLGAS